MKLQHTLSTLLVLGGALAAPRGAQGLLNANEGLGWEGMAHGSALAAAGDLDGDGVADYWVGAPSGSLEEVSFLPGRVYLVSGASGASLAWVEGDVNELFGLALAAGRDLTGDGVPDLVVGAPFALSERGQVRVYSGADRGLVRTLTGLGAGERFGQALALLDDVSGDGVADLAIGAPGDDRGATDGGSVRLHSGASGVLLATLFGAQASDAFGSVLANAGDIDGDGKGELLIGIPKSDVAGSDAGLVQLLSGADGHLLRSFAGQNPGDEFGRAVAGSEDLDGDGVRDLLLAAPRVRSVRAFSGATGAELWSRSVSLAEAPPFYGWTSPNRFGTALCSLGDQDGDGHADVAVGYPEASRVLLLSGTDGATLEVFSSSALLGLGNGPTYTYLGYALLAPGDLDGDGRPELVLGAPMFSYAQGGFNVYHGRTITLRGGVRKTLVRGDLVQTLGGAVASAGDVDGDGREDVAFSTIDNASGTPAVHVVSGRDGATLHVWIGSQQSGFGRSLAHLGDVDGDGVDDLLVGSSTEPGGGGAWVFSGATGDEVHHLLGDAEGDFFGTSVAALGDCDGDGVRDFAVGAPRVFADPVRSGFCGFAAQPGYVRAFSGASGALLFQVDGLVPTSPFCGAFEHAGEVFGFSVTGVGDWDRDGVEDLAVGAPGAGELHEGAVRVFSGVDGALLASFSGFSPENEFGVAVSGAPDFDLDADGYVDLVVGSEEIYYGGAVGGSVHVISSFTGSQLRAVDVGTTSVNYGGPAGPAYAVATFGDFNRDGYSDVLVGNPAAESLLGPGAGEIQLLAGPDLHKARVLSGVSSWDYLGYSLAAADVNGDGQLDLVGGAPTSSEFGPRALSSIQVIESRFFEKGKKR